MEAPLLDPRQCVCATLRKATRSVTQHFDNALRSSGLRSTQFHVLSEIQGAGDATLTQLSNVLVMDQTTVTRSVALLERRALLVSVPQSDGRLKSVRLTKKGNQTLQAAQPLWAAAQKQMLAAIGSSAWAKVSRELDRLKETQVR